ncbi:MAG: DUF1549 domain-containing protein, partial [Planctomycetales bacterium]|nr:DUF1549 domain-containing protein [Planctomycetales bacterium]
SRAEDAPSAAPKKLNRTESLTAIIDQELARQWQSLGVEPSPVADDATFLRRVSLDLIGRIPTVAEARAYLNDQSPNKSGALVDRLMASPEHARHMAVLWRRAWIPQTETPQFSRLADDYERWLAREIRRGVGFDRLVAEQLTVPVSKMLIPVDAGAFRTASPAFLAVAELKPEQLAANAARAFLGVNLDCAQCHDHPFAHWSREEFWQTAAFFARPKLEHESAFLKIAVGDSQQMVAARFPGGGSPILPQKLDVETGRRLLAEWIIAPENPFFARNLANRSWAMLLGAGLVEPLDDLSETHSQPLASLLDALAKELVHARFQLRPILRAIVLSRAYQGESRAVDGVRYLLDSSFATMPMRGLSGDQLYDSIVTAAGLPVRSDSRQRRQFTEDFRIDQVTEARRSLVQSLLLMNGELTAEATNAERGPALQAIADAPFLNSDDQVETLYLATLTRRPSETERETVRHYLERIENPRVGLSDLLWAMLNSVEFNTNH